MTGQEMLEAVNRAGNIVVVNKRSGKIYDLEEDVVRANCNEPRPYMYGWPIKKRTLGHTKPVWFYAENVRLAEPEDLANISTQQPLPKGNPMTFEQWCDEFDKLARSDGAGDYTKSCGREAFKQAFDEGDTPSDAWLAEKQAGVS